MKVYGPYRRKSDGRSFVIHYSYGNRTTQSYPRYLMEKHLGRKLEDWEEVDHINEDHTDDRIENFQLLTKIENIRKSSSGEELITFTCPVCKKEVTKNAAQIRHNRKQSKSGPFCSRSCAGKHSAKLQYS
jgi:HNH endonuclease